MVDETSTTGLPLATDYIPEGRVDYQMADPYIRALQEFLFNQAYAVSSNPPPIEALTTQIAPFNPLEQRALDLTSTGVGSYLPYFNRGVELTEGALPFIGEGAAVMRDAYPLYGEAVRGQRDAANLARSGLQPTERGIYEAINMLNAGLGSFDQRAANHYMNPYVNAVLENQLEDVDEFYNQKITDLNTQAAGAGLRGSARAGLLGLQLQKQQQEARQDAIERGLGTAFNQAQNQFNLEQQALRTGAPTMANLGQSFGQTRSGLAALLSNLSTGIGGMGGSFAQLGQGLGNFAPVMSGLGNTFNQYGNNLQGLQFNDINALTSAGQRARAFEQAVYDTQRSNAMSIYMDPLNRTAYQQGFVGMSPNTMSYNMMQQPAPSPMQSTFGDPALTSQFPGGAGADTRGWFDKAFDYFG
tara:strand:+ start:1002 stop:2243 length:1242 start_codon:yes stop_codon:yes gene_type:complete